MKILIVFIFMLNSMMAISAEDAAWYLGAETSLAKAYQKAKKEKKNLILLVVVKDGCKWCELMVNKTLRDPNIQENLSDLVTVVVDVNDKLPQDFRAERTPAIFFIDAKRKKSVLENVGYVKKGGFLIDIVSAKEMMDKEES